MNPARVRFRLRPAVVLAVCAALSAAGCSREPPYHPVQGKLTVGGKPMTAGRVLFVPDAAKGNASPEEARARVDATGAYSLKTGDRDGCRPGRYKVVVFAFAEPGPGEGPRPPVWFAAQKYGDAKTTDLEVEVTADPKSGQYDFDLKP
jgi:hypothetical protein